jgi:hypothetical protein
LDPVDRLSRRTAMVAIVVMMAWFFQPQKR